MQKINYKKEFKSFYTAKPGKIEIINIPTLFYIKKDGEGDPNTSPAFKEAVEFLFGISYAIKMYIKEQHQIDYGVLPLEAQWWSDDMSKFSAEKKSEWKWTLMIMQPKVVTDQIYESCLAKYCEKKKVFPPATMRFIPFREGDSIQTMHIGPFSEEGPVIEKMHEFLEKSNFTAFGKHHEIYLSNTQKAAPENWKTILRQPFR